MFWVQYAAGGVICSTAQIHRETEKLTCNVLLKHIRKVQFRIKKTASKLKTIDIVVRPKIDLIWSFETMAV